MDIAMRGLTLQLGPYLVAYRETAADMLRQVESLLNLHEGERPDMSEILPEAAEMFAAMAGVPLREKRRILEALNILQVWHETSFVDVTRAQSVAVYAGSSGAGVAHRPTLTLVKKG